MSILGNMSNLLFGQQNTTAEETEQMISARMKQSSKLNLKDSDIKPLSADPMNFSFYYYPQEVGRLGDGHYMKFHIFENVKSTTETDKGGEVKAGGVTAKEKLDGAKKKVTKAIEKKKANTSGKVSNPFAQNSGPTGYIIKKDGSKTEAAKKVIESVPSAAQVANKASEINSKPRDKFSSTHRRLSESIVLYTPPEVKFTYKANYNGNVETGMLGGLVGADSFMQGLGAGGAGMANLLSSAMQIVSPGIGGLATRAFGETTNPNMEVAFESVPFRDFTFPFTFAPKNKKELQQVHKIIETFKFHLLPALSDTEAFFITPSQFEIEYMYRKGNNNYIPKVAKCVLESMEVNYAPGEKFTTLKPDEDGASPQIINISLQFKEMLVLTKKTVAGGY